jgi:hypothetical protein
VNPDNQVVPVVWVALVVLVVAIIVLVTQHPSVFR